MSKKPFSNGHDLLRDARQLYEAHRAAATKSSRADNLEKVWDALNAMRIAGGRDYSIAEIGRQLEKMQGPKTQSLRNAQGAPYREIIAAFANAVEGSTRYVAKSKSNVEQALDMITDQSIRATLRFAIDDAKRLKVVNDNLHAAFKTLHVGASFGSSATEDNNTELAPPSLSSRGLSVKLINALRKGIDESRLAQQGLHASEDGSIENDQGDKVFPPSFVSAIRHILA